MNLGGLLRVNVADREETYSELLLFLIHLFIFFNSTCMRTSVFGFQSLVNSFVNIGSFSVQVGCAYDKFGGSSSERHQYYGIPQ